MFVAHFPKIGGILNGNIAWDFFNSKQYEVLPWIGEVV